jgi:hypothetical protein
MPHMAASGGARRSFTEQALGGDLRSRRRLPRRPQAPKLLPELINVIAHPGPAAMNLAAVWGFQPVRPQ